MKDDREPKKMASKRHKTRHATGVSPTPTVPRQLLPPDILAMLQEFRPEEEAILPIDKAFTRARRRACAVCIREVPAATSLSSPVATGSPTMNPGCAGECTLNPARCRAWMTQLFERAAAVGSFTMELVDALDGATVYETVRGGVGVGQLPPSGTTPIARPWVRLVWGKGGNRTAQARWVNGLWSIVPPDPRESSDPFEPQQGSSGDTRDNVSSADAAEIFCGFLHERVRERGATKAVDRSPVTVTVRISETAPAVREATLTLSRTLQQMPAGLSLRFVTALSPPVGSDGQSEGAPEPLFRYASAPTPVGVLRLAQLRAEWQMRIQLPPPLARY